MKRETKLTPEEENIVSEIIVSGKFGDSYQDKYLKRLCLALRCEEGSKYGMFMPSIVGGEEKYSLSGNYRDIIDISKGSAETPSDAWHIFTYYDYPSVLSSLYVATFNRRLLYPLQEAVSLIGANYNNTRPSQVPITIKIDMQSFKKTLDDTVDPKLYMPINQNNVYPSTLQGISKSTLKYVSDRLLGPEEIFDVQEV